MERRQLLENVRELMQDALRARFSGGAYNELGRAHGYADGYMRALMDAGLVDRQSLLELVGEERRRFVGDDRRELVDAA